MLTNVITTFADYSSRFDFLCVIATCIDTFNSIGKHRPSFVILLTGPIINIYTPVGVFLQFFPPLSTTKSFHMPKMEKCYTLAWKVNV